MAEITFDLPKGRLRFDPSATPMSGEAAVGYHPAPPPFQCFRCGRFARCVGEYQAYDGDGTQLYVSVSCKRCGEYTESMW